MENTTKKKIIIIFIYLLIFVGLATLIYARIRPKPSCSDGIQDQNEAGVDCGGVCAQKCVVTAQQNLAVVSKGFVDSGVVDKVDVYADVSNPNQTLGSDKFAYHFNLKDSAGNILATQSGIDFILPGATKYVIETNLDAKNVPTTVEFVIDSVSWEEANQYYEEPQLKVVNKNYSEISNGVGFSEATGLVKNESPLDFAKVRLTIILQDFSGQVVALNATELNSVKSEESRDFRVGWPNRFPGNVSNMEVQTAVNVFDATSFAKQYFTPANFQRY